MKSRFQSVRAGVLIEAALVLSLFTGIMFTGWRVIQSATVRTQMTNALGSFGRLLTRDSTINVSSFNCNKSTWNDTACTLAKSVVEGAGLPLCAVGIKLADDRFLFEEKFASLGESERSNLASAGARFHYLTESQSDIFPDRFQGQTSNALGIDSSIRRKFFKFIITYNGEECTDKDVLKSRLELGMIFPAYNAFENDGGA